VLLLSIAGWAIATGIRLDLGKLRVWHPEPNFIHPRFLSEAVNHHTLIMSTLLWVWTLR
jgi:hypothetical protein